MAEVTDDEHLEITVDEELLQDSFTDEPESEDDDGVPPTSADRCDYVDNLLSKSELKLLHDAAARAAYEHEGELGLFYLFLNKTWFKAVNQWCNQSLSQKGFKKVSYLQFMAYMGLEVVMSIVSLNSINDYWRTEMFLCQQDFTKVMSRDNFKKIV
jgi:hypothetical protein